MNRDIQIDIVKGLAIFFVVAGHIISKGTLTWQIIYLFHIPLFFMISGYFHKKEYQEIKYLKNKIISLLIPYFSYLLIFSIPLILLRLFNLIKFPSEESASSLLKYIFKLLYGGQALGGDLAIFWFITCLFLTGQLFNFIAIRVNNIKLMFLITIIFYLISFYHQKHPHDFLLPWSGNVVFCSFLFYFVGAVYGQYIFKNTNILLLILSMITCIISLILINLGYHINFDMKYLNYGFFIISPLAAIAWTKLLVFISIFLAKQTELKKILAFSGTASITIMFWHEFFHYRLTDFCNQWPWFMTVAIFGICCILHLILGKNILSRALLLGSRQDVSIIRKSLPYL